MKRLRPHYILRYTYYEWTQRDAIDNAMYDVRDCAVCPQPFNIGETVIDDSLSVDNFHVQCASRIARWCANVLDWLGAN